MRKQLQAMAENSAKYDSALAIAVSKSTLDASGLAGLNTTLISTERALTRPEVADCLRQMNALVEKATDQAQGL